MPWEVRIARASSTRRHSASTSRSGRSVGDDTTTTLWDVASHHQITTLTGHTGPVNNAAFSPDGHILVTGSDDGTARLWDLTTHQQVGTLQGTSSITGVAFNPDGHTVATAGEDTIARLWNTGGPILIPSPPALGYDLVFNPDGRILVTAGAPAFPHALFDQLAEGGILIAPIGDEETQHLTVIRKRQGKPVERPTMACRFVKLIGEEGWSPG